MTIENQEQQQHSPPCSALQVFIAESKARDMLISEQLKDIKLLLQERNKDFESRLRRLEKWMWMVAGTAGVGGGAIATIAQRLIG